MGSRDRAINEKSGRALALPYRLMLEAVCLYKEKPAVVAVFERNA